MTICTICTDDLTSARSEIWSTHCGHVFHFRCLEKWLRKNNICPQCRKRNPQRHRIFLSSTDNDASGVHEENVKENEEPKKSDDPITESEQSSENEDSESIPSSEITQLSSDLLSIPLSSFSSFSSSSPPPRKRRRTYQCLTSDSSSSEESSLSSDTSSSSSSSETSDDAFDWA